MSHLLTLLQQNNQAIRQWGYPVLFAAAWLEGFNSMIIGGFIASVGKLNIWLVFLVMTLGHTLSGVMWYAMGFFGGYKLLQRWGQYVWLDQERLERFREHFAKYGGRVIFITHITVGFTIAAVILAGALKMQFKKFMAYVFLGSLTWTAMTVFFGYTFGLSFRLLTQFIESFTRVTLLFFLLMGAAILLWHILQKRLRVNFTPPESEEFSHILKDRKTGP